MCTGREGLISVIDFGLSEKFGFFYIQSLNALCFHDNPFAQSNGAIAYDRYSLLCLLNY